jgi:hypothetical protein
MWRIQAGAAQVQIVGPRLGAGRHQGRAIQLIGADRGQHRLGPRDHGLQRGRIVRVGGDQRRLGGRADLVADGGQLVQAAPGHGPADLAADAILLGQILGDQPAGEAARAIDDDVEVRRRVHAPLPCRVEGEHEPARDVMQTSV